MDKYEMISVLWVERQDGANVVVEAPYATASEGDLVLFENDIATFLRGDDIATCYGVVKAKVNEYKGSPVVAMLRDTTKYYKARGVYTPKWLEGKSDESSGS